MMRIIDSHTGGEPTRLIIEGLPKIEGSVHERLESLRQDHDWIRKALCTEPKGNTIAIGAAVFPPSDPSCLYDVVFFNNESYLGMCGHGTIGVVATLSWLGQMLAENARLNTVSGIVKVQMHDSSTVSFENVLSYRSRRDTTVEVKGYGDITGDIAYGGNWFFLVRNGGPKVVQSNIDQLMAFSSELMNELERQEVTGSGGEKIDHVEVFGPSLIADSKNFVLCPGKQYDRSPCGTGTSAKLACLMEDGTLNEGEIWRQESIIGSVFEASASRVNGGVLPIIKGSAYVTADTVLHFDQEDPFVHGFDSAEGP